MKQGHLSTAHVSMQHTRSRMHYIMATGVILWLLNQDISVQCDVTNRIHEFIYIGAKSKMDLSMAYKYIIQWV